MANQKLHFETLQLHVGQEHADPATDARAVPIYQTSSYVFHNSAHAAARFGLADPGNIYSRLTNTTQDILEQRIAALEGGVGALAVASGAAAITYAILNITRAGDHVVSAKTIYGGTYDLLEHTLVPYGISTTFVDPADLNNFEKAIRPETKLLFIETFGNPNGNVIDIEKVAEIAHRHQIPLVVDNTFATPFLLRPIELGADIVVHSATKFIGGHGTTIGGVIAGEQLPRDRLCRCRRPRRLHHPRPRHPAPGHRRHALPGKLFHLPAGPGNALPARRAARGQCAEGRGLPVQAPQGGQG